MENFRNIIVIGASAGGMKAIATVLAGIAPNPDATVLIVMHISRNSNSAVIAANLQKHTTLSCHVATDGTELKQNNIYLAQPNHHLMVKDGKVRVNQGPHENKYRPSIDVLFRSAAVEYGNRAIGIILTGMLDDGTSGMWAIKQAGGICIIQDPEEADFSDMPKSVSNRVAVDFSAAVSGIPEIVNRLLNEQLPESKPIPEALKVEAHLTERMMSDIDDLKKIGDKSDFVCPDCGGGLWTVKDDPVKRYRCYTGHVYSERLLHELQDSRIDESIWVSIRMLEERSNMLMLMADRAEKSGDTQLNSIYNRRIDETNSHIERLKSLLTGLTDDSKSA